MGEPEELHAVRPEVHGPLRVIGGFTEKRLQQHTGLEDDHVVGDARLYGVIFDDDVTLFLVLGRVTLRHLSVLRQEVLSDHRDGEGRDQDAAVHEHAREKATRLTCESKRNNESET